MNAKKTVVPLAEAETGPNKVIGTYRRVLTEASCGARQFSLCVNTLDAGSTTPEITRKSEQGWYILSGRGEFTLDGQTFEIGPGMGLFAPEDGGPHRFRVGPDEDLNYVLVFGPRP